MADHSGIPHGQIQNRILTPRLHHHLLLLLLLLLRLRHPLNGFRLPLGHVDIDRIAGKEDRDGGLEVLNNINQDLAKMSPTQMKKGHPQASRTLLMWCGIFKKAYGGMALSSRDADAVLHNSKLRSIMAWMKKNNFYSARQADLSTCLRFFE